VQAFGREEVVFSRETFGLVLGAEPGEVVVEIIRGDLVDPLSTYVSIVKTSCALN
jgi:hypothetical protein